MSFTRYSSQSEREAVGPNGRQESRTEPSGHRSRDTWILIAGVVAALFLVAYIAAAFASTSNSATGSATTSTGATAPAPKTEMLGPWTSVNAKLTRLRGGDGPLVAVRVTPVALAAYGARVPAILGNPVSGTRAVISLWLKGSAVPVRIGVAEFGPGSNREVSHRIVRLTGRWHHYVIVARVTRGHWTGLGLGVYRSGEIPLGSWFAVRNLSVALRP
jgi:hypothetical protein